MEDIDVYDNLAGISLKLNKLEQNEMIVIIMLKSFIHTEKEFEGLTYCYQENYCIWPMKEDFLTLPVEEYIKCLVDTIVKHLSLNQYLCYVL